MLNTIIKIMLYSGFVLLLTSCEQKLSEEYLLSNPEFTLQESAKCLKTYSKNERCEMLITAANQIKSMLTEMQADPEAFGQRIIDLQIQYSQAQQAFLNKPSAAERQHLSRQMQHLSKQIQLLVGVASFEHPG